MTAPGRIIRSVCAYYDLKPEQLRSRFRHQHLAQARHVAALVLRLAGYSYASIARFLGRSDHTTAMSSCEKAEQDLQLRSAAEHISAELGLRTLPVEQPDLRLLKGGEKYVSVVRETDGAATGFVRRSAECDGLLVSFPDRDVLLPLKTLRELGL